jgi:hypothetical protein
VGANSAGVVRFVGSVAVSSLVVVGLRDVGNGVLGCLPAITVCIALVK